jgi:flagellar L-ring protein FlgH
MSKSTTRSQLARSLLGTAAMASLLANCAALDRIKQLGEPVTLTPIENPTAKPGYKPVQMPMPMPQPGIYNPNSLWRNGSRAFFNDQRAHQVGDILTVKVNINDTAQFNDQTALNRTTT